MNDRTSIILSALAGAVIGGCAGYLLLTEDGRRLREDLQPRLEDFAAELNRARSLMGEDKSARADVRPFGR